MAGLDVSVSKEQLLPGLLGSQDGLAKLVEAVLKQVLEAPVTEALGAERHERAEERTGYLPRTLYTRIGQVTLPVPQTRDGRFSTDIFKRYQRSEQAFVLALMEMVVQGVSPRKVSAITEDLCGARFSKSTVSRLCVGLDARVKVFNERRWDSAYPFVLVDAMFIPSRQEDRVQMRTVLIVSGIRGDGLREILGVKIGDSESFATWDETFRRLKRRGLQGVACVLGPAQRSARSDPQALLRRHLAALPGLPLMRTTCSGIAAPRCAPKWHRPRSGCFRPPTLPKPGDDWLSLRNTLPRPHRRR